MWVWGTTARNLLPPSVWFKPWRMSVRRIYISLRAGSGWASPWMRHNICRECIRTLDSFPWVKSGGTLRGESLPRHQRWPRRSWFCPVWLSIAKACLNTHFRCPNLWIVKKRSAARKIGPYCSAPLPYLSRFQTSQRKKKITDFLL